MPRETLSPELLGSISHALAGPLISGRVAADALRARDPADEDVRTVAECLARAATILDAVVRIGAAARTPFVEELSLDDAVRAALRRIRAAGDDLEVEAGPLGRVRADESHVVAILAELLANVAQHAGPEPRARLRSVREGDEVLVTVGDDGPGLPDGIDRERPAWFARTGSGSPRAGSGLAVVFALAAADGGRVELRDGAGGGTEVTVRLPAAGAA